MTASRGEGDRDSGRLPPSAAPLPEAAAAALVFASSGAVLVLEILAVRLLAPYVGLTIEAYTTIIGVILAGIALGSWLGGRAADRVAPRLLVGPLLSWGGLLAIASIPIVRALGEAANYGGSDAPLVVTLAAFLPAAAVLSAVTPTVAKLQLGDLGLTGSVVGRLSAWATAGALTGTFVTGFVLVPLVPTQATVLAVGGTLVVAGIHLGVRLAGMGARRSVATVALALLLGAATLLVGTRCERESPYFCARVQTDPERPSGRVLVLDGLRHSYVDLSDAQHLEFPYTRWIAGSLTALFPAEPVEAVFLGGGGFTLPRWLIEARPGSRATVLEVDSEVVDLARDELGLRTSDRLRVQVGDARVALRGRPDSSADVIVGDAYSTLSVPWHLTTREFLADISRVLRSDGAYMLNLIDYGDRDLLRAQAATLLASFDEVAIVGNRGEGPGGLDAGNHVLVAGDRPLTLGAIAADERLRFLGTPEVERLAAGGPVLRDDRAPADQLLTGPAG